MYSTRRSSSIVIPSWGGLRFKAMLANEWYQLKQRYKDIQKQNMRKLKQSLKVRLQCSHYTTLVVQSTINLNSGFDISICWSSTKKTH